MADVFLTEDYEDAAEDNNQDTMDDLSGSLKENTDMTLKQENSELFSADDLLVNPDDLLPPVVKLEKYANSDIVFNRQVVARNLLETLRLVHENSDDVARVINVLGSISDDYDSSVRTELMVQLPHIAAFCHEVKLNNIIVQYLVPMLLSYLRDENNLVRKFSHSALLSILEQGLIDSSTQSEKVWPLILHMTDSINPEDIRTESILLMSKLVVLMGAEEQFYDRLFDLCVDRSNNIRKACASIFGDICTSEGREVTEEILLPKFFALCEDNAWCVRKACAENFMPVSCVVSREIRCKELSSLYMILLSDQSRWVRVTAYQALGPFISTFAEPDKTGLYYSKDGILTIVDNPLPALPTTTEKIVNSDENSYCNGDISNQLNLSYNGKNNFNFDRTSSEPCDNVVPLSCVATSHTPDVPSISCKVGNHCTVIEVSSPHFTTDSKEITQSKEDAKSSEKECSLFETDPIPLSSNIDSVELQDSKVNNTQNKTLKLNNEIINQLSAEEFVKLWDEATYGCDDCASGDLHSSVMNGDMDIVNNKLCVEDKILDNITPEEKSVLHNIITVNGVNYGLNFDKKSFMKPFNSKKISSWCKSQNLKQCVLNKLSKGAEDLSNLNLHSTNCLEDEDSASTDVSSSVNISSQESSCTDCISIKTESDDDVLKLTSEKLMDQESAFNSFQYWREPIPPIDLEEELSYLFDNTSCIPPKKGRQVNLKHKCNSGSCIWCKMQPSLNSLEKIYTAKYTQPRELIQRNEMPENKGEPPPKTQYTVHDQDIVPPELLLQYLSMIDSAWAQTIDAEIARHCAYSLPAVALTLGRKYWPCLKETFDALTSDLQGFIMMWKVRRTVASAMHQLAVILGPEITSKDLLPVFSRFISDLDEVRIGILQHLYDFLKILRPEERVQFLPSLPQFLISNSDVDINEKNWRFRLILAEQLVCIADLYEPQHVRDHLVPLSLTLIKDKVCEVRLAAVRVMAAVMRRMSQSPTQILTKAVMNELTEKFVHSPKWLHRQLYVYVCQEFIVENSLSADQFSEDALPQLLYLCWDRVPNVRLAIARCLVTVIWPLDTFSNSDSSHRELLLETIHTLQSDLDADVRFYANMVPTHECSCLQNGEFNNVGDSFA